MAYSPCINHGIKRGMGKSQDESKLAVDCGYWPLYRYNPTLKAEGKNPFILDSKDPDGTLQAFLAGEIRYASLQRTFPEEAKKLHTQLEAEFLERFAGLKRLAEQDYEPEAPAGPSAPDDADGDGATCTLAGTAEHAGSGRDADDACDDGRAG